MSGKGELSGMTESERREKENEETRSPHFLPHPASALTRTIGRSIEKGLI